MNEKRTEMTEERDADELTFISGSIIGTFTVGEEAGGRKFWVYVCAHARGVPHFHVYDKDGDPVEGSGKRGVHVCVEIRKNLYCTHGPGTGMLDQEGREALDRFMREVRRRGEHCCDVGKTNFFHTAAEWNDNNAPESPSNWIDPEMAQPDYRTIGAVPCRSGQGLPACVQTFAILPATMSPAISSGKEGEASDSRELENELRKLQFRFCCLPGRHGGRPACLCLVFNIGLADVKYLCQTHGQGDFILAVVRPRGKIAWQYYRRKSSRRIEALYTRKSGFVEAIHPGSWPEVGHAVSLRTFEFRIPGTCFGEFAALLKSRCALSEAYRACLDEQIRLGIDGGGARNRMHYRAAIYGDQFHRFWDVVREERETT